MRGITGIKTEPKGKGTEVAFLVITLFLLQMLLYLLGGFTKSEVIKRVLLSISAVGLMVSLIFPLSYVILRNKKNKK
ncbi:hypothetical protein THC_1319 [Caldimicrobium thiodismutans]|jgi:hypothetical protein|uniref:Uncharacterized protein n=1 Tax=Caldimicrobium thiodismutans TaxID=1653476 RepID=A0A0U5AIG7_9BACT|nr:hypothetical protein [Caldimicrobium thiodismutans]BAU23687.1 hypothetical protein THC_1319 [Caldimicrobium thiodismutans]